MLLEIEFTTDVLTLELLEILQSFSFFVRSVLGCSPIAGEVFSVVKRMEVLGKSVNIDFSYCTAETGIFQGSLKNLHTNIACVLKSKMENAPLPVEIVKQQSIEVDQAVSLFFSKLMIAKVKRISLFDALVIYDFSILSQPKYTISDIKLNRETVISNIHNLYLKLKKADFITDSLWQFVTNKVIYARIEDDMFLKKVRKGDLRLCAGMKLFCTTRVTATYDKLNMSAPKSISYTILQVNNIAELVDTQLPIPLEISS